MAVPAHRHEAAQRQQLRSIPNPKPLTDAELLELHELGRIRGSSPEQSARYQALHARLDNVDVERALRLSERGQGEHILAPGPRALNDVGERNVRTYYERFLLDDPRLAPPGIVLYDRRHFRIRLHELASRALGVAPTKSCECCPGASRVGEGA